MGDITLLRTLGYLEDLGGSFLYEFVHILRLVVALLLDLACHGDEVAGCGLLRDDLGMILEVSRRSYAAGEVAEVDDTTYLIEFAHQLELLCHGEHVDRGFLARKGADSLEDKAVFVGIKRLWTQEVNNGVEGILLNHHGRNDRLL